MSKANLLPPFKRLCVTIGNLPSSYVDSMSYYECLMWLCKYLKETVVPTVNENAEAVNELIHWFENLDVQDEIDNKLDEMVESGELQEIISEYLNSKAIFGYDTVADMISATNLIDGSYARTMGYYEKNDGGSALYRIREVINTDITDGGSLIAMEDDQLVAELIPEKNVNAVQFGCIGDGETDNNTQLCRMFDYAENSKVGVFIPKGNFFSSLAIPIKGNISISGVKGSQLSFPTVLQEALVPASGCSFTIDNVKITTLRGTGVHISHSNNKNCFVTNCDIDTKGFGILVEENTDGGSDLHVIGNNISSCADAVEINTIHQTADKFKNVVVANNILETKESESGNNPTGSGFAFGVATGKNISVTGNVIKASRREAIHIEDGTEDIVVTDNVLNNCKTDGIIIYNVDSKSTQSPTISNNIIKSESNDKSTGNGIYLGYSVEGSLKYPTLTNNQIYGFKNAFRIDDYRCEALLDNSVVVNCANLFDNTSGVLPEKVKGKIILRNVDSIYKYSTVNTQKFISVIDYISMEGIDSDNWLKLGSNNFVTFNHLDIKDSYTVSATGDNQVIKLFKMPKAFNGTVTIDVDYTTNRSRSVNTVSIAQADGTITKTELYKVNEGSMGTASLVKTDDGYLAISTYFPSAHVGYILNYMISFDGQLIFNASYNN